MLLVGLLAGLLDVRRTSHALIGSFYSSFVLFSFFFCVLFPFLSIPATNQRNRKFAKNIGVKFSTPEEYFLNEASAEFEWGSVELTGVAKAGDGAEITEGGIKTLTTSGQEIVLFVGFPASGKSTLARKYMVPAGYVHVNRDTLKTKEKCLKVASAAVNDGKSVVVCCLVLLWQVSSLNLF